MAEKQHGGKQRHQWAGKHPQQSAAQRPATARGMQARGYSLDDIAGRLSADGITDNTLSSIMKILEAER